MSGSIGTDTHEAEHLAEITGIVAGLLSTTPEQAAAADDLLDEFGIDSLVLIELFMRLERRYSVSISEEKLTAVTTVRSVYRIVAERAGWTER